MIALAGFNYFPAQTFLETMKIIHTIFLILNFFYQETSKPALITSIIVVSHVILLQHIFVAFVSCGNKDYLIISALEHLLASTLLWPLLAYIFRSSKIEELLQVGQYSRLGKTNSHVNAYLILVYAILMMLFVIFLAYPLICQILHF